jgi:hypothetical protein
MKGLIPRLTENAGQWGMTDVPLSLAIVSTITPVIAGALPLTVGWIRDAGREKRAEAERLRAERSQVAQKKQANCVGLLRLAREFRVLVENTYESSGKVLDANAELVRQFAAGLASQADKVEFMISEAESEALALANAAGRLGAPLADQKNRKSGSALLAPNFTEFDDCLADFKRAARAALGDQGVTLTGGTGAIEFDEAARSPVETAMGGVQERL